MGRPGPPVLLHLLDGFGEILPGVSYPIYPTGKEDIPAVVQTGRVFGAIVTQFLDLFLTLLVKHRMLRPLTA